MSSDYGEEPSQRGRDDQSMSVPASRIPAGSGERVLAEFRDATTDIRRLYEAHVADHGGDALDLDAVERALAYVNSSVVIRLDHDDGTEDLYYQLGDDGRSEWYSIADFDTGRAHGAITLYRTDVLRRLTEYPVEIVKTDRSLFTGERDDLPPYGLDADEDGVSADA
jgi:hypothetical protein